MSKSKGNVVEPWDVISAHGADPMRWSFYTSSPPDYPRRFSPDLVAESVRKFGLTLWNTYSFFVTYANIDGFEPRSAAPPVAQRPPLDRWILSELHNLVQQVDNDLAHYEMTRSARAIQSFVEDLSNWYVRRSRRRFWKSEADEDKAAAHHTLYECLLTLCKLLAPFQPFTAEEMYQNLVRSWDGEAPESVHLCDYPQADAGLIDEQLMSDTRMVMRVVALGHAARNQAGIKVRQPLAAAIIRCRSDEEAQGLEQLAEQIRDELNVHDVRIASDDSELVEYRISAVPSLVGKKYKALFPAIKEALAKSDAKAVAQSVRAGKALHLTVQGQDVTLMPEDLQVQTSAPEGYALAEEAGYMVALSTVIDLELRLEGAGREIVRRIQTMRKEAGFRIEDSITTWYQAATGLQPVFDTWGDYIKQETLSDRLVAQSPPKDAYVETHELDGETVTLGVRRSGSQ
jgi:isoleucyl-tRNA synthetase